MQDIERIQDRLDNISSIEPIITSLRTIADGGWHQALSRSRSAERYIDIVQQVLAMLLPHVSPAILKEHRIVEELGPAPRTLALVVSSERGLCGGFNNLVLDRAQELLRRQRLESERVLVASLGSYAQNYFEQRGEDLAFSFALPVTRVASISLVREVAESLYSYLEADRVDQVVVIYSPYRPSVTLPATMQRWLPIAADELPKALHDIHRPIIEGDAEQLFERTAAEWIYGRFYGYIMESASSEQAARFRAMDAASENIAEIFNDLTQQYHAARQHAITAEMLDLISGSGLLGGP